MLARNWLMSLTNLMCRHRASKPDQSSLFTAFKTGCVAGGSLNLLTLWANAMISIPKNPPSKNRTAPSMNVMRLTPFSCC